MRPTRPNPRQTWPLIRLPKSLPMSPWMISRPSSSVWCSWTRNGATILPKPIPDARFAEEEEKRQFMFDSLVAGTSLQEMLLEQVRESVIDRGPAARGRNAHRQHRRVRLSQGQSRRNWLSQPACRADKILEVLKVVQIVRPPRRGRPGPARMPAAATGTFRAAENRSSTASCSDFMEALGKRRIPEIARGTRHRGR